MVSLLWGAALVAAVLWPGRVVGPLDGAPLDTLPEAILIGLVLPVLWALDPGFLRSAIAKALVVLLLTWKIATTVFLTQGGWCGEFLTPDPPPGSYRLDRSWDLRAYFQESPPACSAIVARGYDSLTGFPAWSINAPIDQFWILGYGMAKVPSDAPRPPAAYKMIIEGWMRPSSSGTMSFDVGDGVAIDGRVAGASPQAVEHVFRYGGTRAGRVTVPVAAGEHFVSVNIALDGDRWRFVPRWNNDDLFTAVPTAVGPATTADRIVGAWGLFVAPLLVLTLFVMWSASTVQELRPDAAMAVWIVGAMAAAGGLALTNRDSVVRWGLVALAGAAFVPVPERLRRWRGAFLLVGLPWLAVFAVRSLPQIGHFTIFSQGDDWLTFQQFAYRIFMQGQWLLGGESTFWYQPLYRWTTGVLHLAFGDASVGDLYWDVFGLLVGALFAFEITSRVAGFRIGIVSSALTLVTLTIGPNWYVIGRGLSEISASAWLFLAALTLMTAPALSASGDRPLYGALAGVFGVLAFYTRLNHLPLAVALAALAWPVSISAGQWIDWRKLWTDLPKRLVGAYLATLATGLSLFGARTWHYTGRFSVFAGTTRAYNGTGLGTSLDSMWSGTVWRGALESVMMIVTVQDPPRFDPRSLLVVAGVLVSLLGLLRVPIARRLPLGLAFVCVAAIAGGLVARGIAYPGRFSIHLIPLSVAASICAVSLAYEGNHHG